MRNDQPHHRGGMPLEVGPFTPILGYSSSPTLDQTVASNNKFLYRSIIGASSVAVLLLAKKWWEQRDRSRMHRVALRELTGESPEREHHGKQQMPGSIAGMGALSSSSSSESRTSPIVVKRRQRASSKSGEAGKKPQSDARSLSKDPSNTGRGLEAVEQLTSKLKSYLPSMPTSPRKHQISDEKGIETAKADEPAPVDIADSPKSDEPSFEATDESNVVQFEQSMSAAERKKAKKKQNRAKQQRQVTPSTSSHVILPESSPEASTSLASSSITIGKASSETQAKMGAIFSRGTQLVESDRTDSESATPTATAHPTPKAKSKSKMESVVHDQDRESPTRSRTSSAASSLADERRESNDSAPSLSHTLSPRSDMDRLGSMSSLHPLTPAPAHTGLNLLDADFESLRNQEHALEWEQVGSSGKPKKKKKRTGNVVGSSISPPASSASPLSTASNPLPNMEAVSNQTTDATSASWILDQQPCPDCERRKQEDLGRSEPTTGYSATLAAVRKQLNETGKDERSQRDLVRSLTLTNASLSERLDHMRHARDALQATAQTTKTRISELEQTVAKQREDLSRANSRSSSEEKRAHKEKGSDEWKKKYDTLAKEFNEHKFKNARASEEVEKKVTRQQAHIQELSRMLESFRLMPPQLDPGMMLNPNMQYQTAPPMVIPPNPSPVTPGFMAVPMQMPYSPSGYSVNAPGQLVYPPYENAPRRPPHPQPPRHHHSQRYERQPSNGPPVASGQVYQQLSGMWSLASPTASTSRPPSSPSRSSDVSSSILKARNTSADRTSSRGSGGERSAGETGLGLHHSDAPPEILAAAQPEREADQLGSPSLGAERKHALIRESSPSETRSAPGRVQASKSVPTPLPEKLEIKVTQSTPVVGVSDSPSPGTVDAETEAVVVDLQSATAEEEYEEPIYASIRLPAQDTPSGTTAEAIQDSPAKEGLQTSKTAETADDDFAEPIYASIRGPAVEANRQEDQADAQVDDQNPATQPSESESVAETLTKGDPVHPNAVSGTVPSIEVGGTAGAYEEVKPEADSKSAADKEEAPLEPPASMSAEDDYEEPVFASIRR